MRVGILRSVCVVTQHVAEQRNDLRIVQQHIDEVSVLRIVLLNRHVGHGRIRGGFDQQHLRRRIPRDQFRVQCTGDALDVVVAVAAAFLAAVPVDGWFVHRADAVERHALRFVRIRAEMFQDIDEIAGILLLKPRLQIGGRRCCRQSRALCRSATIVEGIRKPVNRHSPRRTVDERNEYRHTHRLGIGQNPPLVGLARPVVFSFAGLESLNGSIAVSNAGVIDSPANVKPPARQADALGLGKQQRGDLLAISFAPAADALHRPSIRCAEMIERLVGFGQINDIMMQHDRRNRRCGRLRHFRGACWLCRWCDLQRHTEKDSNHKQRRNPPSSHLQRFFTSDESIQRTRWKSGPSSQAQNTTAIY